MKRFLCLFLSVIMLLSTASFAFAEEAAAGRVEISFKVGDSTLMINGTPVTVETPYIAGEGTTLVPLRVITEAFGALVTWVNETQEIILEYPDVNITLQIGNKNATVNNHTEVLPEAPVLSPNGVTMVPLRFVSETFGATVSYDNATSAITVVKETVALEDTISSSTDLPRIGDSYWGWSMMTPSGMMMEERYSDGCYTYFEDEESSGLSIDIYDVSDYIDTAYDEHFNDMKNSLSDYTLSRSEKGTDAFGNKNYRFTARDKEIIIDFYSVFKGDYCYEVLFTCEPGSEKLDTLTTILESFKLEFAQNDEEKAITHDLSNVGDDGYRLIEDEDLKISFKIPATCINSDPSQLNLIWFTSGKAFDPTEVTVGVYSKSETVTAEALAKSDRDNNAKNYNPELITVSPVCPYETTVPGENARYYWITTEGLYSGDYEMYDVFFEKGDYVYNVTTTVPKGEKAVYETVMATLETDVLDSAETGAFLKNDREYSDYTSSSTKWSLELDRSWQELAEPAATSATYANMYQGAIITVSVIDAGDIKQSKFYDEAVTVIYDTMRREGLTVVERPEKIKLDNKDFYRFRFRYEDEEAKEAAYTTVYMILMGGNIYMFNLVEEEAYANAAIDAEFEEIISSFEIIR